MNEEEWRPIAGWEGFYEISSKGRVRSLERKVRIRGDVYRTVRERILVQSLHVGGYPKVNLVRNGGQTQRLIHQLLLETFVGPAPEGMITLHRNGIRTDYRLENLHWGTAKENWEDSVRHGTAVPPTRARLPAGSKLRRPPLPEHCKRGHLYDTANTDWQKTRRGGRARRCRTCSNELRNARRAIYGR